jgi:hypothetical protein
MASLLANTYYLRVSSLRGWLDSATPIVDVQLVFLSLHQVIVNDRLLARMEPLPLRARWQLTEVSRRKVLSLR